MAVKKRVFQVAREFNISNEALIEFLRKLNHDIRNHMSLLTDDAYQSVTEKYGEEPAPDQQDPDYEFRKRLRDRKVHEEERKKDIEKEIERRRQAADDLARERPTLKKKHEEPKKEPAEPKPTPEIKAEKPAESPVTDEKPAEPKKRPRKKLKVVEIPPEGKAQRPKEIEKENSKIRILFWNILIISYYLIKITRFSR